MTRRRQPQVYLRELMSSVWPVDGALPESADFAVETLYPKCNVTVVDLIEEKYNTYCMNWLIDPEVLVLNRIHYRQLCEHWLDCDRGLMTKYLQMRIVIAEVKEPQVCGAADKDFLHEVEPK